jgi:N-dimethylarginine dimethylaminohydrolase
MANRAVLMGDPTYFSIKAGANPHTRSQWGKRKHVDRTQAIRQWHVFARSLCQSGVRILVIPPRPHLPGLVYPANAGFLFPGNGCPLPAEKHFYLANLLPARAGEQAVYEEFLEKLGFRTAHLQARFEGEADFFPVADLYLFTYGRIEAQRFRLRLGMPPYERVYGFRSEIAALKELQRIVGNREILPLELGNEAYYHGDTALCSFGPSRQFLLGYLEALTRPAAERLQAALKDRLIPLSPEDAALYAANSFPLADQGHHYLFMPAGVSANLLAQVREREVEPVLIDVTEFLAKGGGSVKCMLCDLGPESEEGLTAKEKAFRQERDYQNLLPKEE